MKREIVTALATAALAVPAGFWLGGRRAADAVKTNVEFPAAAATDVRATGTSNAAPEAAAPSGGAKSAPASAAAAPASGAQPRLSIGEVEEKLLELNRTARGGRHGLHGAEAKWIEMITSVDAQDIPRLLAFAEANLDRSLQMGLRHFLIGKLAENDLQGAIAYANGLKNRREREQALTQIAGVWSKKDPAAAIEWARNLPATSFRDDALRSIVSSYGATEPEKAFQLVLALGKGNAQNWNWVGSSILGTWAAKDPLAAARMAEVSRPGVAGNDGTPQTAPTSARADGSAELDRRRPDRPVRCRTSAAHAAPTARRCRTTFTGPKQTAASNRSSRAS